MSRRRISVKDLGQVDCQGWLYRKKESRSFLGIKWKKYWFVLKTTSLYWYTCETAEKAEGYINLTSFTVDQAKECKKKYAMRASHPHIATLYFAAESFKEMNKWLSKLSTASAPRESSETTSGECYSEASDHEEADSMETSCPQYTEQLTTDSIHGDLPPPLSSSSPCQSMVQPVSPVSNTSSQSSVCPLSANSESWLDIPSAVPKDSSDEMEILYMHLKQASLSPTGELQPSTKRDFRSSFIRRCRNETINEKLHLIRTLNSTLKAKEADLLAIEQVLADPALSVFKYRQWREANALLLQEIRHRRQPAGGRLALQQPSPAPSPAAHKVPYYAETSL